MNINSEELQQCYDEYIRQINEEFRESLGEEAAFHINGVYITKFDRPLRDLVGTCRGNILKRYGLVSLEDIFKLGVLDNKFSYRLARNRLIQIPGIGSKTTEFLMREVYPVITVERNGEEIVYSVNDNPYLPDCKKEGLSWCRKFKKRFYSADPTQPRLLVRGEKIMNETWSSFIKRKVPYFARYLNQKEEEIYKSLDLDPDTLEKIDLSLSSQQEQKLFLCFLFLDFLEVGGRQPNFIDLPKDLALHFVFFMANIDPFFKQRATGNAIRINVEEKEISNFLANIEKTDRFPKDFFHLFWVLMQDYNLNKLEEDSKRTVIH
jgi:hypothetical protein